MAINTLPVFTANSPSAPWEPAFTVSYPHDGIVYVAGFSSIYELTNLLVAECIEGRLVEQIIDFAEESLEWHQPEYPLGVTFIGEAVSDSPVDEPVYPPGSVGYEMQRFAAPSPFWEWAAATLRIGAVTAPWVLLMLLCRMAWGWL